MKTIFLTSLLVLVCSVGASGQGACPKVEIREMEAVLGSRSFMAAMTPRDTSDTTKYKWSIDKGKIFAGQDTALAMVEMDGVPENTLVTISVVINGYGCELKSKMTFKVGPPPPKCPIVTVTPSSATVAAGKVVTFTSKVEYGFPAAETTYSWFVEGGVIASGQGTPTITVEGTAGLKPGAKVTAKVDVGPTTWSCEPKGTATVEIGAPTRSTAEKFHEFGALEISAQQGQLDLLTVVLRQEKEYLGYVMVYAGRYVSKTEAEREVRQIRDYFDSCCGEIAKRVRVIDGGRRKERVRELWLVPPGAEPPKTTPTVKVRDF